MLKLFSVYITEEGSIKIDLNPQLEELSDNVEDCISDDEMEAVGAVTVNMCHRLGLTEEVE